MWIFFPPEANVPLETQVTKLVNEYDKIFGVMTVTVDGKEITIPQAAKYLEEPDRAKREQVWRATIRRRLSEREKIDAIFDQLIPLRQTIAHNSGLPDYRAYCWKQYKRFDYTPKDCYRFADAIAATCVPLVKKLDDERAELLAVDSLRPWDMNVDIHNRPPLRPFEGEQVDQFVTKTKSIFERLSPELATQFESLRTNRNLDLDSRKGKQPGGYQSSLEEVRQPFIFMNASGMQDDVETLLHEGGHAFHYIAARQQPLVFLRSAPMEFCEVASMAMELFGGDHLDIFYSPDHAARAKRAMLEGVIRVLPWIAAVDSFQHWLYENPAHTREQRTQHWSDIVQTFGERIGINIDWTGFEDARDTSWQRQLHLFHVPFYYIEYGIAQLGALQLWMKALEDPRKALANYRAGLALGGTRTLPELFAATGISFDFSEKTLRPLMFAGSSSEFKCCSHQHRPIATVLLSGLGCHLGITVLKKFPLQDSPLHAYDADHAPRPGGSASDGDPQPSHPRQLDGRPLLLGALPRSCIHRHPRVLSRPLGRVPQRHLLRSFRRHQYDRIFRACAA